MILVIDPGKDKCGLAVLDQKAKVFERSIINRCDLIPEIEGILNKYGIKEIILGSGTHSKDVEKEIIDLETNINVTFVPEKNSTLLARKRYFKENPRQGLLSFVPTSLLVPPVPIDDWAAVILGERYLEG